MTRRRVLVRVLSVLAAAPTLVAATTARVHAAAVEKKAAAARVARMARV